ncbi:uncharacterized protein LOC131875927 [Cryptomeria japonica]|uniref:uncharacterized protein LOC131875927 n=1 Tax=Cryptomeria japonica TaxID=3369 RepID=UPI0027DA8A83|nr:uncharacterized protein LOC131875927 [Cryptomeria japonica]
MENTLIGKFYGMRPNIEVVRGFVKRKWNLKGQVDVVAMNKGCLSFSFSCEEDHMNILCNETWAIRKYLMYIQKWYPNARREKKFVVQVPIWIKLLGLPIKYWEEDVFARIANAFRELIAIDPVTASRRRLIYASNCKVGHWAKKCPSNVVKSQSQAKVWKKVDNSLKASHSDGLDQEKQSQVGRREEVLVRELGNETKRGDIESVALQEKEQNGKESDDGERESQVSSQKEEKEKDKTDQNSDNSEKRNNGHKSKDNKEEGDNFNLVSNSFESDKEAD